MPRKFLFWLAVLVLAVEQLHLTSKEIEVTETADNSEIVAVIQEYAQEVMQFVAQGMSAMMNGRMR